MSEVSVRPRVKSVSNPVITTAVAAGAILIGRLIRNVIADLASPVRLAAVDVQMPTGAALVSVAEARERWRTARFEPVAASASSLQPVDAAKASALSALAAAPYYVRLEVARVGVADLARATTLEQVRAAEHALLATVAEGHQPIVVEGLTLACRNAAQAVGLTTIDVVQAGGGVVRMTATDAAGSGVVSEIEAQPNGNITLATEVVDGDGRCHALLDAFELALERQGVLSDSPDRRSTGGVCQLAAAKAFVRRRLQPKVTTGLNTGGTERAQEDQSAVERRRRLNPRNRTKGR